MFYVLVVLVKNSVARELLGLLFVIINFNFNLISSLNVENTCAPMNKNGTFYDIFK